MPTPTQSTEYTGHNARGGLQKHSTGEIYPFTIIGVGYPKVQYCWMDTRDSRMGELKATYQLALIDFHQINVRQMMYN